MSDPALILRRVQVSPTGRRVTTQDYDVFDGDREVGRIYLVHFDDRTETWFWGVSFRVTKRKSYGYAESIEDAKAAFRAEYLTYRGTERSGYG
ncbi:MAG: hypothetical protein QOF56_2176 [Acidobacteriaceae bacterium]|nr:hypothetical protein [Acidobacteriaceae bacterium]